MERLNTMRTIYLVSCVAKKSRQPKPAGDLYESAWFRKARAYVEEQNSPWFILSAEHGLLRPDEVIAPYNRTLNKMGIRDRRAWADRVVSQVIHNDSSEAEVVDKQRQLSFG